MIKNSRQKYKYLEDEKSFSSEIKACSSFLEGGFIELKHFFREGESISLRRFSKSY